MKTLSTFIIILATSTSVLANSSLNGTWQGQGQLSIKGQSNIETCDLFLQISQTESQFSVIKSDFKCPSMHIKNKAQTILEIKDHRLFLNNIERGYIDDSTMYSFYNSAEGLTQSYLLKTDENGQSLNYSDNVDWNKSFTSQITGTIRKISESLNNF